MGAAGTVLAGTLAQRGLAALTAGTLAGLLIVQLVLVLSMFGPPSLIPDLARAALTPAEDLAQSRNELVDPYIGVMAIDFVLALVLFTASLVTRRPRTEARPRPAAEGRRPVRGSESTA